MKQAPDWNEIYLCQTRNTYIRPEAEVTGKKSQVYIAAAQVLQSAVWTIGAGRHIWAGRHVSLRPPPIPLVYNTANLIGVDWSMRIPLCTIL